MGEDVWEHPGAGATEGQQGAVGVATAPVAASDTGKGVAVSVVRLLLEI